jgi:hypothetical protein
MYASTEPNGGGGGTPAPQPVKHRTITLTNNAPIRIIEDEWPVLCEAATGTEDGPPWGWDMRFHVRKHKPRKADMGVNLIDDRGYIIYATFRTFDETNEDSQDLNQTVRVGRRFSAKQAYIIQHADGTYTDKLCKQMSEVANELRERILNEKLRKYVTVVLDRCFADLPAHDSHAEYL